MIDQNYIYHETEGVPVKTWTKGVPVEDSALAQLRNVAALPFIHKHVAAMPDVHWGMGATIGSVIATKGEQKIVVVSSNRFAVDTVAGQQSLMLGASGAVIQKVNPANEPFFVNCIQWLNDNEAQIGLGAVTEFAESRLTIEQGPTLTAWKWFVWAGWPAVALFVGMGAWFVRRR